MIPIPILNWAVPRLLGKGKATHWGIQAKEAGFMCKPNRYCSLQRLQKQSLNIFAVPAQRIDRRSPASSKKVQSRTKATT
jgi:hypothetical protein